LFGHFEMRFSSRIRRSGVRSAKFIRRPAYVFFSIRIHEFSPLDSRWAYSGAISIAHIMSPHLIADPVLRDRELCASMNNVLQHRGGAAPDFITGPI
jgi:hypothetical protein